MRDDSNVATNYNTRIRRKFNGVNDCSTAKCMRDRYCDTMNIDPIEHSQCLGESYYDFTDNFWGSLFEILQGPWVELINYY
jgi:hypothetical protein